MSACLVLIDIQKGFLNSYTNKVIDNIKAIIKTHSDEFNHIVATRFSNSPGSPFTRLMNWNELMDKDSIELDPFIENISERIFEKKTYSCFVPEFIEFIHENKIDKIYFAGIDTDCCVLKSAADCFENNICVEVLINACASTGGVQSDDAAIVVLERLIGCNNINFQW